MMIKHKIIKFLMLIAGICAAADASGLTVGFDGASKIPVAVTPPRSTGLMNLFVVYDISEITSINVSGIDMSSIDDIMIYSNLGGGYGQRIDFKTDNNKIIIPNPRADVGYIIQTSVGSECFWVVNYADKRFNVSEIDMIENQPCDYTELAFDGEASAIRYYSISGQPMILDREITVSYFTSQWDQTLNVFEDVPETKSFEYIDNIFTIRPPLYSTTSLTIKGDKFLRSWGDEIVYESKSISPNGILVQTVAEQTNADNEENSNQIKNEGLGLGGSAPAEFVFTAYTTENVIHYEWQIAEDPEFEYVKYRFNEKELNYTFYDEGKYYVRFIGSNGDGSCEAYGEEYSIGIGASDLRIPNAFSPDGDGINDIWKVGYSSLIEFKCWIFDRHGQQLFFFDNPQVGWDGKYKGKTVSSGVYYYVIEAKGADGVKYKKGGDINIINYRKIPNNSNQ